MKAILCPGGVGSLLLVSTLSAQFLYPDLATTRCHVSPTRAQPGQVVQVTYDVCNVGQWGTGTGWVDAVRFNSAPQVSGSTVRQPLPRNGLFTSNQCYSTFNANQPVFVVLPSNLARGTYYIGYVCNDQRAPWPFPEQNYGNNDRWAAIEVDGPPNLVVDSCSLSTTSWLPGQQVRFDAVVRNRGGNVGNGSARLGLYLSSTTQPPIATHVPLVVPADGSVPVTLTFQAPAVAYARYQLTAFIDDQRLVAESSEDDNTCAIAVRVGPAAAIAVLGAGCSGSSYPAPVLGALGLPFIGNGAFELRATSVHPGTLVSLFVGPRIAPPRDLTPLGMPGCMLHVDSPPLAFASAVGGAATFRLPVPDEVGLVGARIASEVLVFSPGANALHVLASNGLELAVGW